MSKTQLIRGDSRFRWATLGDGSPTRRQTNRYRKPEETGLTLFLQSIKRVFEGGWDDQANNHQHWQNNGVAIAPVVVEQDCAVETGDSNDKRDEPEYERCLGSWKQALLAKSIGGEEWDKKTTEPDCIRDIVD